MGNQITISGSIKSPQPQGDEKMNMLYFTQCALGAPAADDLSVFEKKEDMLFFHFMSDSM